MAAAMIPLFALTSTRWNLLIPDLDKTRDLAVHNYRYLLDNWWATFSVSAAAAGLALILALMICTVAVRYRAFDAFFVPVVAMSQSFPLQAIAPLLLVVLGVGFHTKLLVAFVIAFFPIYGTCLTALKRTPDPLLARLQVCRASFMRGMWYVRIPAALPSIVSSAKVGFTLAVLGAVVAEFIQPDKGLGNLLIVGQSSYNIELIYLCLGLLVTQGVLVYATVSALESYLLKKRSQLA